jgi:hypothetical protein
MKIHCQNIFLAGLFLVLYFVLSQQTFAQSNPKVPTKKEKVMTITGKFVSKQGVMTALSCHCYEGGEVTTDKGEVINICLKGVKDAETAKNCIKIRVKGYYINETNNPEPTNPCPKGSMRYFKVISYKCL